MLGDQDEIKGWAETKEASTRDPNWQKPGPVLPFNDVF